MFKKIYIEITNICNLHCPFCLGNKRKARYMTKSEFECILKNCQGYTKYLYFHILGEPLMHPKINEFIDIASKNFFINLTTNGYYLNKIADKNNIRQINISLHSYDEKSNISLEDYLNNIYTSVDKLKKYTYISYRLWVNTPYKEQILASLKEKYQVDIKGKMTLEKNVFIDFLEEFTWPSLNRNLNKLRGRCYALKDQLGILVDGTVVPCCLDGEGIIKLGNIYKSSLKEIMSTPRFQKMLTGFNNNSKVEALCQNCDFLSQKDYR